ncbi:MAG TPA: hypothetical protein VIQ31_24255 [Phormidium sp.]
MRSLFRYISKERYAYGTLRDCAERSARSDRIPLTPKGLARECDRFFC